MGFIGVNANIDGFIFSVEDTGDMISLSVIESFISSSFINHKNLVVWTIPMSGYS